MNIFTCMYCQCILTHLFHHQSRSHNVRLGLFPRVVEDASSVVPEWYDIGIPGFIWHCVGAREEGNIVTCWMPIFEDDYSDVPIHLATEGHSYLHKIVIDTSTKSVIEVKKFQELGPTERCAVNDLVCIYIHVSLNQVYANNT